MRYNIIKSPLVKSKQYCPNPIVRYGIPNYADAISNPKVKDTLAYHQFWEEQLYYIHNGYTTGGITIPGRYYKFVNFDKTQTVKGAGPMELHDFQLDFALWVEDLKARRKNGFLPKARRKSVSVMTAGMIMDYGWRFNPDYHGAVVAGLDEYSQDFMDKWRYVDMNMVKEFKLHRVDNQDELVAMWKEQSETGWEENGTKNTVYVRTVNKNANVLKGKFLHDIIMEESGENELLLETFKASEMCLKLGGVQFGTFWIYGTAGNMDKGSKGFKHVHHHLSAYNAEEWYLPGTVFFFPAYAGATDEHGKLVEDIPNLLHLKPHERVGMSDIARAEEIIKAESQRLLETGDMEKFFDYRKENPIDLKEIFRKTVSNNFDVVKLNEQLYKIEGGEVRYNRWKLNYKMDKNTGAMLQPAQIELEPASPETSEDEVVYILNSGHPIKGWDWLFCAGLDSYDQDEAKRSKSLGSMVVFIRNHNIPDVPSYCPVAVIRNRPKHKEQFYELCLKLAVYYDLKGSVLVDYAKGLVIQYFKDAGFEYLLSRRPKKFESPNSQQTHDYGVSINNYSKPKMVGALQTLFAYHCDKVWFDVILNEALNYDEVEIGSDNDSIDALGIALMKAIDMDFMPVNNDEEPSADPYDYPVWAQDSAGNLVDKAAMRMDDDEPLGEKEDWFSRYARQLTNTNNDMSKEISTDDFYNL